MKVKMNQLVQWSNGHTATPREMLDRGLAEVRVVNNFRARTSSQPRKAVFVDLLGTMYGVEVSGYVKPKMTILENNPYQSLGVGLEPLPPIDVTKD